MTLLSERPALVDFDASTATGLPALDLPHRLAEPGEPAGRPADVAADLLVQAEQEPPGPGSRRASLLTAASDQFLAAGRADEAVTAARAAVEDGGAAPLDPRFCLVAALDATGRTDEARAVRAGLRSSRIRDLAMLGLLGDSAALAGDLDEALWWFSRALCLAERQEEVSLAVPLLLLRRWHVRDRLGLPADDWDACAAEMAVAAGALEVQDAVPEPRSRRRSPGGRRGGRRPAGRGSPGRGPAGGR